MSIKALESVSTYRNLIESCLQRLADSKNDSELETAITEAECADLVQQIQQLRSKSNIPEDNPAHYAAIEAVFRKIFVDLIANYSISDPGFAQVWILLDVITILSDNEACEAGVGFWLVEELLDSQTIEGCRRVFDYLESRRERMTAKHFKHKSLVILRCCNELLRRLSRAEDTVFCGRVFIFLFQSFPLGDKSSVNLRGEFHVENVTIYDTIEAKAEDLVKPMEIDSVESNVVIADSQTPTQNTQEGNSGSMTGRSTPSASRVAKSESKVEEKLDLDVLYPKFWNLQNFFSSPTRLFDPNAIASFKDGIGATLSAFKMTANSAAPAATATEFKRGTKRKRGDAESAGSASTFNPKYLTNRDLFDLEVHDVAFRRHILVQALIMLDFLLSLTPAAQTKFAGLTNKSVLYPHTLSEEDAKWAQSTRASIASYLQQGSGNEGKFYFRMVDTVLSRDKNWVRWKAENCPSISRQPVDAETQISAQISLEQLCAKPTLVPPPGAGDLQFLSKYEPIQALKHPSGRHKLPTMADYWKGIEADELDMDFANDEEKKELEERKAGRVWRALRSSRNRFVLCERIQNGTNLKALIEVDNLSGATGDRDEQEGGEDDASNSMENGVAEENRQTIAVNG